MPAIIPKSSFQYRALGGITDMIAKGNQSRPAQSVKGLASQEYKAAQTEALGMRSQWRL
jgi:hypothetical protein